MSDQKRPYRKTLRAELEAQTRRRITESAVELHGMHGPARTSISAVAEHAGVRRSTVYRHFGDEAGLFAACTAHWTAENPPPDLAAWAAISDPDERTAEALAQIYAYYQANERMLANLHRDASTTPIVEQLFAGFRHYLSAAREALLHGRNARGDDRRCLQATIGHALAFPTWHSLTREQQLDNQHAARLMSLLIATTHTEKNVRRSNRSGRRNR